MTERLDSGALDNYSLANKPTPHIGIDPDGPTKEIYNG
jgi:hypothetical protein